MATEVVDIFFEYNVFLDPSQRICLIVRKKTGYEDGIVSFSRGLAENKHVDRTIKKEEWQEMADNLFEKIRIQDWEKRYEPEGVVVSDGYQWKLLVTLVDRTKYEIVGNNEVPENWEELMDLLQPFFTEYEALPASEPAEKKEPEPEPEEKEE